MSRLLLALCVLLVLGCRPGGGAAKSQADRRLTLEARLAQMPASPSADVTLRRAPLLRAMGAQERALTELEAAVGQAREQLDFGVLASLWREIGAIQIELGRPEAALDTFGKRLEAAASLGEDLQRASALVDTAHAFVLLGAVGQADEAVTQARIVGGEALLRDPLTVERLGLVAYLLMNTDDAADLLAQASERYRASGDDAGAARTAVRAAHLAAGAKGEVAPYVAVEPRTVALLDAEPLLLLRTYQAERELAGHAYDRCHARATEAVTLADGRGVRGLAKHARLIAARCAKGLGKLDEAARRAEEAAGIIEEQLEHVTGDVARQELSFEAFQIYRLLFTMLAAGKERVDEAFEASERARARAHLDAVARSGVGAAAAMLPVPEALVQNRAEAEARVRQLTETLLKSRSRDVAERHRDALWALEDIRQAIQRNNPLLSRVASPEHADVDRVREVLVGDDGVLLSYFMADDKVFLFVVDSTKATLTELPGSADDIARATDDYRRRHLLDAGADIAAVKRAGQALYATLLGPAADVLARKRRVVVVPHGVLSSLPFEALVDGDGRYVVERHDVVYSLSASLATTLAARASQRAAAPRDARKAFVGMGDPVYDWQAFAGGRPEGKALASTRALELWDSVDKEGSNEPRGLERLLGTSREVQAIARLFGGNQKVYLRAQASEEAVKKGSLQGYRIVHIASHGLMAPHYQALALTIRPGATDDGFLMNSELGELDLDAELVVLSACRTGNTRLRSGSEPVAGLALSLRGAGALRVVLSLWSVDDDATAELMLRFYRPLVAPSPDYAHSLAEAKRAMIAEGKWSHPFFWAAFVLHGSGQTQG